MDATLIQLIDHIYDLEREKALFIDFIQKNEAVLRQANAVVPGLPDDHTKDTAAE